MIAPTCVLFDLDHTLTDYDHERRVQVLAQRIGFSPASVHAELFTSGLERESDLGRFDPREHARAISRRLGVTVTLDDCIVARAAAMTPDPEMIALVQELSGRATLAILTNNGLLVRDHFAAICPEFAGFFGDRVFCSAQLKLAKPDPAIFLACAERLGIAPECILFTDDKAANVDGARAAGLQGQHFRDAATLRAALVENGVLPA
ncbi:HAD family hydrolase [Solilutibacter silvestris]|uniref:HAD-SF-IA-v3: HAD hydrolase, family IA, variant 3 n=1 Tax=Solilutibacter silvestris TaxID=1645665 RepID=A0A2K1Q085_9GAMM|nr:HAD family phosphatase [Lysobacter silvestris]PNS08443.1 HAD-SF-IA-v3: HAD hydrolase, family IA, variant 3 [Lysobacter silvestris]